jgi:hypothetical protein
MKTYPDQGTSTCPRCAVKAPCPCIDFDEVDVGIGCITGNHQYLCEVHGVFAFGSSGEVLYQDE